ncbi:HAD-IIIC family phosphatase [Vibrio coralliirubri]|uniref:HAD-IIIC family phosphatase n=1 Tax=Vibrio coralliirubri TaxID=1516159 RepID=UPI002FDF21A0
MKELFFEPLNNINILRNKNKIKNDLLPNASKKVKLLILSGSTIGELKDFIYLFLLNKGIEAEIYEGQYKSYYEEVMFSDLIDEVSPDWVYVHTTNKNISRLPRNINSESELETFYEEEITKISTFIDKLESLGVNCIINNYEMPQYRNMGNYDFISNYGYVNYINKLNSFLSSKMSDINNVFVNDIMYTASYVGLANWYDSSYWYGFKYAVSPKVMPNIAKSLSNIISSISGNVKKVLVCDLDNTLWGGVIGDDGPEGVSVGQGNAKSESFDELQAYVLELKRRGIILAVNSKNELELAREGFSNSSCRLSYDDFGAFIANWESKSGNMNLIEADLNLFQDSFVFIDDNPAEIKQVSDVCPTVTTVTYQKSVFELIKFIDSEGLFDVFNLSEEDKKRSKYYEQNKKIKLAQSKSINFDEYLTSLEMVLTITPINAINMDRVIQLVNKTNQFNPTTSRVTKVEYEKRYNNNGGGITLCAGLTDLYGDNGIVTTLFSSIQGDTLNIDTWVMSCRVFNRELEFAIFDNLVELCKLKAIKFIEADYIKSIKNGYVEKLYENLGFELISQSSNGKSYKLEVNGYKNKCKNIKVNYEY